MERERLELQGAAMTRLFHDRLFFAPLSKNHPPQYILDIGTGTGDWAIHMGDVFPTSQVIGTDLSPIQPDIVPPNVNFYIEDSSEPWFYSHSFDYIHTRVTTGSWANFKTQVADQAYEALSPGGWFESQEFDCLLTSDDGTLRPDSAMSRWMHDMLNAAQVSDRPFMMAAHVKQAYLEAGFVDVHERVFKMPINPWPKDERLKELGRMWHRNMTQGLSGFSVWLFNRVYDRSPEETEVMLVDVRREMSDMYIHAYMPIHVVWGRKPYPHEIVVRNEANPGQAT
ncbi:methyltransferase domain-containing protein [Stachybotrys elegans]|uniref:Methyltransferase domain-containing protein n=1 Tax=Stachybotrys elegans TaxID=80388 RepID=A0A8K0WUW2_9HYPO|nr:methyltransferase domain-containing protein [Stachybotrys elegans]